MMTPLVLTLHTSIVAKNAAAAAAAAAGGLILIDRSIDLIWFDMSGESIKDFHSSFFDFVILASWHQCT